MPNRHADIPVAPQDPALVRRLEDHAAPVEKASFTKSKHKIWWIATGGVAIVALWSAIAVRLQMHSSIKATPEMTRLTFDSGLTTDPAVSPDGKLMAYATDRGEAVAFTSGSSRLIPNGQAVQLTRGDDDDHQPDFSPDCSKVAFRSERDGGGIYMVPAIGGDAVLIAKGGRDPRFSPDGKSIAFWQAEMMAAPWVASYGTIYLAPSVGGPPQPVVSDLKEAGVPQWSDDGKRLIVFGRKNDASPVDNFDWWVVPVEGGPAISTHAFALLKAKGFNGNASWEAPRVASWRGDDLLFSARRGDSTNVWKVRIDQIHFTSDG